MSRKLSASGGFTQLMMACEEGDLHRVKAMLPSPHLNAKNQVRNIQHGYSALALAVKSGHLAIVKELISAGADINSRNNVALTLVGRAKCAVYCMLA
jgi:ankyrin repeat protein